MLPPRRQNANHRQWATAVLRAEIAHATDDFWRCVYAHGAGLLFDPQKRVEEARPFRFQHEVHAIEAWDWLGALNVHEGWKRGPWALWMHWNEKQRADWRVRWFCLARGFLRRMRAYTAARMALVAGQSCQAANVGGVLENGKKCLKAPCHRHRTFSRPGKSGEKSLAG